MFDAWALKLGVIAGLMIAAAGVGVLVALFRYLVWWPTLLLQAPYRPGLVIVRLFAMILLAAVGPLLFLPPGLDVGAMVLLWLTVVPGLAERWVRAAAWKRDSNHDRSEAAVIRRSIMARRGNDRTLADTKPWPEYIIDKARLERRRRYRPPGH